MLVYVRESKKTQKGKIIYFFLMCFFRKFFISFINQYVGGFRNVAFIDAISLGASLSSLAKSRFEVTAKHYIVT
jgi:hypothetical protein